MKKLILSVIIPTKNRYKYLKECLLIINDFNRCDFEIVVHDNSENNVEILSFIDETYCPNLKYYHDPQYLTVSQNSDSAIKYASGQYVVFIGDDDCITETLIDLCWLLNEFNVDACNVGMAGYYWPDVDLKNTTLNYFKFKRQNYKFQNVNTMEELKRCINLGGQSLGLLPRVYHAVLSREVLSCIKKQHGTCFPGPSPDMANAVASSFFVKTQLYFDAPLLVSGSSAQSTAGMALRGTHKKKLKEVTHLGADIMSVWDPIVPALWLQYTIWPASLLLALKTSNQKVLINGFNRYPMLARIILRHPDYIDELKPFVNDFISKAMLLRYIITESMTWFLVRLYRIFDNTSKNNFISNESLTLRSACKLLAQNTDPKDILSSARLFLVINKG